ncbi:MAG: tRNA (adenosine(37)-N6)-threonylcarbamoyltransferase complex dimerization subunit type 1 TsaB [Acidobacteriota bacterium]
MITLSLDTSTKSGSISILRDENITVELNFCLDIAHSEIVLNMVDLLLKNIRISLKDLDGYSVCIGPGSFTGIRTGLSVIKALAYASNKKIAPVTSLDALTYKLIDQKNNLICPIIDARKGELYGCLMNFNNNLPEEIIPKNAYMPDSFLSMLPLNVTISFIGNGAEIWRDKIKSIFGKNAHFPPRSNFISNEIGIIGHRILSGGNGIKSFELKPFYIRASDAELSSVQSHEYLYKQRNSP